MQINPLDVIPETRWRDGILARDLIHPEATIFLGLLVTIKTDQCFIAIRNVDSIFFPILEECEKV